MYKTLDSYDFKDKRVLVRIDINSEIKNNKIVNSDRISSSAKTIKELMKKKAKVVLLAHQGRKGEKDFTSLEQHAKLLNKYVNVKFINDIIGLKAIFAIKDLKPGQCILLENVRALKEEMEPTEENRMVKRLVNFFDYYVNDAFSVSHRNQTSITEFPKYLKSCIGRTMETELKNLNRLNIETSVFILGGAKVEDVELLFNKKHVLTTGVPALICLLARDCDLGLENDRKKQITEEIRENLGNILTPVDLAININGKRKELTLDKFPVKYRALDIGTETIKQYSEIIKNAKAVFMKGTAGFSEIKGFEKGTKELLKAIAKSNAFSVIAGGHTTTALKRFKINKNKFNYISLSGGALVYYLAGKKLPGLEALKQ